MNIYNERYTIIDDCVLLHVYVHKLCTRYLIADHLVFRWSMNLSLDIMIFSLHQLYYPDSAMGHYQHIIVRPEFNLRRDSVGLLRHPHGLLSFRNSLFGNTKNNFIIAHSTVQAACSCVLNVVPVLVISI